MSELFPEYHKINSIQKRHKDGPLKGQFTGEWVIPELAYLADNEWVWREKIDGTNIRVRLEHDSVGGSTSGSFGGRTDNAQIPVPLRDRLAELFASDDALELVAEAFDWETTDEVLLYGEGYGAGIQKGGGYGPVDFILFDVKIGHWWMNEKAVTDIALKLNINRVPIVGHGTLNEAIDLVSTGKLKSAWSAVEPEGVVAVPTVPLFDRAGRRIITKIKGVDFK